MSVAVELFNSLSEVEGEWASPGRDRAEVGPYVALYGYPDGRLIPARLLTEAEDSWSLRAARWPGWARQLRRAGG